MPNFIKIARTAAEIERFFDFSKMAAVRHLGFVMLVSGPPTKGTWCSFFITVQNFVGIDAVVLVIRSFFDFASLT